MKAVAMDYYTHEKIRAYVWQDLHQYIDTPESNATLELSEDLGKWQTARIEHEHKFAMGLFQCIDLTPQEKAAAHLWAVISNARLIAWQREPCPPDGNKPAAPLEEWQAEELTRETRDAAEQYAAFLPEREAAALIACISATGAVPVAPIKRTKPVARSTAQDEAILEAIRRLGHDPLALPKPLAGKGGVKADIRASCLSSKDVFLSKGVFDDAWQRLRDQKAIGDYTA